MTIYLHGTESLGNQQPLSNSENSRPFIELEDSISSHFNIILFSRLGLPNVFISSGFPIRFFSISNLSHAC